MNIFLRVTKNSLLSNYISPFHKDWFLEMFLILLFETYSFVFFLFSLTLWVGFCTLEKTAPFLVLPHQFCVKAGHHSNASSQLPSEPLWFSMPLSHHLCTSRLQVVKYELKPISIPNARITIAPRSRLIRSQAPSQQLGMDAVKPVQWRLGKTETAFCWALLWCNECFHAY